MYLADIFTVPANLAGLPGLSLPCGLAAGLPVGLQLLGRPFDEATLLRAGAAYQSDDAPPRARPAGLSRSASGQRRGREACGRVRFRRVEEKRAAARNDTAAGDRAQDQVAHDEGHQQRPEARRRATA